MTRNAVIVDAVRTATGRRNGQLSGWHPVDLAGQTLSSLLDRSSIDSEIVEDVIMGCALQVGLQSVNIARSSVLAAGWPESVPGTTIDRQCGSSQQAVHFAAQGVVAGAYDVVVAAGVEIMTSTPMGTSRLGRDPFGPRIEARYRDRGGLVPQGEAAERIAEQWRLEREEMDRFGERSHRLARHARDGGRFDREIVPVPACVLDRESTVPRALGSDAVTDESIRETSIQQLRDLAPAFRPDGRITAGTSSQIADGASACLIVEESVAGRLGLEPLARIVATSVVGVDPQMMLTGPIPATHQVLDRAGLALDDIDRFEVNEAFASVVLAWQRELGADLERVNVNGGAIALGHPLGCSGTRLLATLIHELDRSRSRFGLQTMCEGGGLANALVVERMT